MLNYSQKADCKECDLINDCRPSFIKKTLRLLGMAMGCDCSKGKRLREGKESEGGCSADKNKG